MNRSWTRFGLRAMTAIVALCLLTAWAWRVSWEGEPDRFEEGGWPDVEDPRRLRIFRELGGQEGASGEGVRLLIEAMLGDASPEIRRQSAPALAERVLRLNDPSLTADVTAALVRALKDEESPVRAAAASALGRIGSNPDDVIVPLLEASSDEDERVRGEAVGSLGQVQFRSGMDRTEVREAIARAIRDPSERVRDKGLEAFSASAEKSPGFLRNMLGDARSRGAAVEVLTRQRWRVSEVVPKLTKALDDPDPSIRRDAFRALQYELGRF